MKFFTTLAFLATALLFANVHAQPPRENARGPGRRIEEDALEPIEPGGPEEQERSSEPCTNVFRTFNGNCTNPFFKLFGSTNRAQSSLFFARSSEFPTGEDLPSPRFISNALLQQSTDIFNDRDLNELLVFFGQFIDHTFASTPLTEEKMPIKIPEDDPIMANFTGGELKFKRSARVEADVLGIFGSGSTRLARRIPTVLRRVAELRNMPGVSSNIPRGFNPVFNDPPVTTRQRDEGGRPDPRATAGGKGPNTAPRLGQLRFFKRFMRPSNSVSSAIDLSVVYGSSAERAFTLRSGVDGKLKVSEGDLLPLNERGLNNAPSSAPIFFVAGDTRSNEHPVLTAIHTIFLREHNDLCDELKAAFPDLDDTALYENARKINTAQFQKIVFEEFYPAITGRRLPRYRGFRFYRNPTVLDVFSTAGFRVGHTMVGNQLSRRGPGNTELPPVPFQEMFFRRASTFTNVEHNEFLRGAMQTNAQEIDLQIQNSLRNFLFTNVNEEEGFDLASLNIQRGRDHALPSYNAIRQRLGISPARRFSDISRNRNVQSRLSSVYESVDDVEAWVGLIAEDHTEGSSLGRTMVALWDRQFLNFRDGDRFFFRNNIFPDELREKIPRVNRIFNTRELFREILIRNSDITSAEIPPRVFFKR